VSSWREFDYYPPSRPRPAKGGIKARSKRGAFASSWWGARWVATLESFPIGARLGRGRAYARKGQVLSLEIDKGKISAEVQGSRPRPYAVSVTIKPIAAAEWKRIARAASETLLVAAKLIAGEMPPEIEAVFAAVGVPLFPAAEKDLATRCSCPDWSNPCKHVAAVTYLLAEAFDRDPFLLFRLRGIERDRFIVLLGLGEPPGEAETVAAEAPAAEPITARPGAFWSGREGFDHALATMAIPERAAALAGNLGGFPFWRGEADFPAAVSAVGEAAARHGLRAFLGEGEVDGGEPAPATVAPAPPRRGAKPAIAIARSVGLGYIVCLEDGRRLKRLARHLKVAHGLTPDRYRRKWGLAHDYPMVAPADRGWAGRGKRR